MQSRIIFTFDVGLHRAQSMTMSICDKSNNLKFIQLPSGNKEVEIIVTLPTEVKIDLDNRSPQDVEVDSNGNIIENKFIHLQKLKIENIEIPDFKLNLCKDSISYIDTENKLIDNSFYWDKNGTFTIKFNEPDPLIWWLNHKELW